MTARAPLLDALEAIESARRMPSGEWQARCPAHQDRVRSLTWTQGDDGRALLHCHAGCAMVKVANALGFSEADAFPPPGADPPQSSPSPPPTLRRRRQGASRAYEVRDLEGHLVAIHDRRDNGAAKQFGWRLPDGTHGLGGLPVAALPLYGSEHAGTWDAQRWVWVTEGERACDALRAAGEQAVATVTGAAGTPGDAALAALIGMRVLLAPDQDDAGRDHMRRVAERLAGKVADADSLRWLEPPADAPTGWDVADALEATHEVTARAAMITTWTASAVPVPGLEPAQPLAEVLDQVVAFVARFVVLPPGGAEVCALWVAHTWAIEQAGVTPYLAIVSPAKGSGKTRLLEVMGLLLRGQPGILVAPSAASVFRLLAMDGSEVTPLLLDELDTVWRAERDDDAAQLRGILNSGYKRGSYVPRVTDPRKGTVTRFPVFGPRALAAIGSLPDTLTDRAIILRLSRRLPTEPLERFRLRPARAEAEPLVAALVAALAATPPAEEAATPPELSDRAADHWEPLLAISDAAAGTWPQRARQVAVILAQVRDTDTEALAVRLLADIRQVFRAAGDPDHLFSHRLLEDLHRLEEAPWADLPAPGGGPPGLRPHRLASLLRGFDIRSTTIRPPAGAPAKGYYRVMFEKPWQRYLPAPPDPDPAPEHPTGEPAGDGAMAGSLGLLEEGGGA